MNIDTLPRKNDGSLTVAAKRTALAALNEKLAHIRQELADLETFTEICIEGVKAPSMVAEWETLLDAESETLNDIREVEKNRGHVVIGSLAWLAASNED